MRYLLLFTIVLFLGCVSLNKGKVSTREIQKSQGYKSLKKFNYDTTAYIKENFQKGKSKYIGKNLDAMLNDLEVPILNVGYSGGNRKDIISKVTIYLYNNKIAFLKVQKTQIIIILSTPLNKQEFMDKRKGSPSTWSEKDFELLKDSQIADILVVSL